MKNNEIKIMILGSGELGKEFTVSAQRLGLTVIAVDNYADAPAMQVADFFEVIDMLDAPQLEDVVAKHQLNVIVPEIKAIRTEKLKVFERRGIRVVPLKLKTARFTYAETEDELIRASVEIRFPNV